MNFKQRIEDLYYMEASQEIDESQYVSVSFKIKADTAHMLSAIAERFSSNRHVFGGEILDQVCMEMFQALTPEDRTELAERADKGVTEQMLKAGHQVEGMDVNGPYKNEWRNWAMHATVFNLEDERRKAEKEGEA